MSRAPVGGCLRRFRGAPGSEQAASSEYRCRSTCGVPQNLVVDNAGAVVWVDPFRKSVVLNTSVVLQPDGNAVGYGQFLAMQTDGNLVLYGAGGSVGWSSHSPGAGPSHAAVQDDGNFVVYAADGRVVWASNTNEGRINIGGDKPRSGGGGWDFLSILLPFIHFGGGGGGCHLEVGC
jgi:hypothetical protein